METELFQVHRAVFLAALASTGSTTGRYTRQPCLACITPPIGGSRALFSHHHQVTERPSPAQEEYASPMNSPNLGGPPPPPPPPPRYESRGLKTASGGGAIAAGPGPPPPPPPRSACASRRARFAFMAMARRSTLSSGTKSRHSASPHRGSTSCGNEAPEGVT